MHWIIILITGLFYDMPVSWWFVVLIPTLAASDTVALILEKPRTHEASAQQHWGKYETDGNRAQPEKPVSPSSSSSSSRSREMQIPNSNAFWRNP